MNPPPPACAVCGVTGVTLYHDRGSGQKRCGQHRRLLACDRCGAAGVSLLVVDREKLCRHCQQAVAPVAGSEPASADCPATAAADGLPDLDALRAAFPLPTGASPLDRPPSPGPVAVRLAVTLDPHDIAALQAMRLGEPLRKAARSAGRSPSGLKDRLGRAVIAAWLARTR